MYQSMGSIGTGVRPNALRSHPVIASYRKQNALGHGCARADSKLLAEEVCNAHGSVAAKAHHRASGRWSSAATGSLASHSDSVGVRYACGMRCHRPSAVTAVALAATALAAQGAETALQPNRRDLSGGTVVTAAQAPFLVFVRIQHRGFHTTCLGTLITRHWIATAAHCVDEAEYRYITVTHISGGRQLGGIGRVPDQARSSDVQLHRHPDWDLLNEDPTWDDLGNDIALLKLPTRFSGSDVEPARLPTIAEATTVQPGLTVRTIGKTSEYREAAQADWPIHEQGSPAASIIAMRMNPAHAQPGDSGGPTLLRIGQEWVLIGISGSISSTTLFAASTSYHRNWITATVDGTELPSREPPVSQPPSTPQPEPSGKLILTLQTENLQELACALETDDGIRSTISGYGKTTVTWTISGSFKRHFQIECQPH